MTKAVEIIPYDPGHLDAILDFSIRTWAPVFPRMEKGVPGYVYQSFYPQGWEKRQRDV